MPLSTLPGLFNQMYGDQLAHVYANQGNNGGTVINIHNPVVRETRTSSGSPKQSRRLWRKKPTTACVWAIPIRGE